MNREDVLAILAAHRAALEAHGVKTLALFGSVARHEAGPESDVDILVEFERPVGLFEFIEVKEYLEDVLGRPVDLVTPGAIRPAMREGILSEAVYAS